MSCRSSSRRTGALRSGLSLALVSALGLPPTLALAGSALPPPLPPLRQAEREPAASTDAVISFEQTEIDFGAILDIERPKATFRFVNTGSEALEIRDIRPACGCTVPELDQDVYKPGESGEISVVFNPTGRRGHQHRQIAILTNDRSRPNQTIAIRADVSPLIVVEPQLLHFGQVDKGESKTVRVYVSGRTDDFEVQRATLQSFRQFDIEIHETLVREINGEKLRTTPIDVTLRADATVRRYNDELLLRTNDPRRPLERVQLAAQIRGDLTAVPPRLQLGMLTSEATFTREIRVVNRTGKPFKIVGVTNRIGFEASNGNAQERPMEFEFEPVDPENPSQYKLRITGVAEDPGERMMGVIIVRTDIEDEPQFEIPFHGMVR